MKKAEPKVGNTLDASLFSLATIKPHDTKTIKYTSLGRYFGKSFGNARRDYEVFCKKFEAFTNSLDLENKYFFDRVFFSWLCVEVSEIDGKPYAELCINENVFLPIAGRQLACIERHARELEMSVVGFADSFNFILNN